MATRTTTIRTTTTPPGPCAPDNDRPCGEADSGLFSLENLNERRDGPIAAELGLKPLKENRRRALYRIPERLSGRYLARLLGLDRSVMVVRQGEQQWTGIRERLLAWRTVPAAA